MVETALVLFWYKNMAKEWAKSFYNSKRWKQCRDAYIAQRITKDGGICEVCGKRLGYILHHKIILTPDNIKNPDISLNHKHMRWECKDCHDNEDNHFMEGKAKPLCMFDSDGQPISLRVIDHETICRDREWNKN